MTTEHAKRDFDMQHYGMTEADVREWALYRIGYYTPAAMAVDLMGQASALLDSKPEHMRETCREHAFHLINRARWIMSNMANA